MEAIATRMTVDEFDQWVELPENAESLYEFIAGEIVEVPSNPFASQVSARITGYLFIYLLQHDIGNLTGEAGGYKVAGERYAPDVGYLSSARQPELAKSGYNPIPPDLAVEVDFPSTLVSQRSLTFKVANYLSAGTTVWLVYPESKEVAVFSPGKPVKVLGINATLDGGDVLPGFVLPIKDVFPPEAAQPEN